jgi:inner membrane protein
VGQQNRVRLNSAWTSPSFGGAFLPANRRVSAEGFEASWEVSWYGRSFPQQSTDQPGRNVSFQANAVAPSLFGVDFIAVVDSYRMVERAAKYGVLFIALIFTAFFLFEVLSALRIHTIQYLLVGAALCLFYLAILSLSEFFRFGYAYCAGAAASSLLIILYCLKVLHGGKRTAIIAAALIAIYTYLYVVLQLQDYSLLVGTAGLFVVLGIVMYSTRNLDWSTRE